MAEDIQNYEYISRQNTKQYNVELQKRNNNEHYL